VVSIQHVRETTSSSYLDLRGWRTASQDSILIACAGLHACMQKKKDSNMQIGMHSDKEQGEMLQEECPV